MSEGMMLNFVVGSTVSSGYFKSQYARSVAIENTKSLDYSDTNNEPDNSLAPVQDNRAQFFSMINVKVDADGSDQPWNKTPELAVHNEEIEKLRKQCQNLTSENQRLQEALAAAHVPHVKVIDNVCLQSQVDTLQWQLKQMESNRMMYRSVMEQVVRFLDRAQKSLALIHEKNNVKEKSSRVPRSRSVHAMHETSSSSSSCTSSNNSPLPTGSQMSVSDCSRFTRAKSVTHISPPGSGLGIREFTWSVLRRNDPAHCTTPRLKKLSKHDVTTSDDLNESTYQGPKLSEVNPNDVPPIKLAQEAYRLMRTVQSLLLMREPDLAKMSCENLQLSDDKILNETHDFETGNFANSTILADVNACFSSSPRSSGPNETLDEISKRESSLCSSTPGARNSIDSTSLNSGSSKEDEVQSNIGNAVPFAKQAHLVNGKRIRDGTATWHPKSRTTNSVSSVEDESGFSSLSSFQEVGIPTSNTTTGTMASKGLHSEVGLPEVPLESVRHRRWSSTPAEFRTLFKRHSGNFSSATTTSESLSVWV